MVFFELLLLEKCLLPGGDTKGRGLLSRRVCELRNKDQGRNQASPKRIKEKGVRGRRSEEEGDGNRLLPVLGGFIDNT
jgi:hypothetical protein